MLTFYFLTGKIHKIMLHVLTQKILGYSLPVCPHHAVVALLVGWSRLWLLEVPCLSGVMLEHIFPDHGFYLL
jgi:hypothetical protein